MAADFESLLGPEPEWLTCPCGEISSKVPCWTCWKHAEREAETAKAMAAAEGTIPARYAWARLGAPELGARVKGQASAAALAARVLGSPRAMLVGPAGSGKTSLAIACLRERLDGGMFVSAIRLGTARIQARAGEGEAPLVERAMSARLLLLDDIGNEARTATNAVKDVIFARYDAELPTWTTTGLRREALTELYGDGFVRRLGEDATVIRFGGAR